MLSTGWSSLQPLRAGKTGSTLLETSIKVIANDTAGEDSYGIVVADNLVDLAENNGTGAAIVVSAISPSTLKDVVVSNNHVRVAAQTAQQSGDAKTALVYLLARALPGGPRTPERCREALRVAGGNVRGALAALSAAA